MDERRLEDIWQELNPASELIDERWGQLRFFRGRGVNARVRQLMDISRITNHTPLLGFKIAEGIRLGLLHKGALSDVVREYLNRCISQHMLVERIGSKMGLMHDEVREQILRLVRMGMVEFHPSDVCNCRCTGCVFSQSAEAHSLKRRVFAFDKLDAFRVLHPKTMILVGGGEPTIYRDGPHRFADLVDRLLECVPGLRFGLVTNGVQIPEGTDWGAFDFVRISLGALDQWSYKRRKGVDRFQHVLQCALHYLGSCIPVVVFNYIMNRETYGQCLDFVHFIYRFVEKMAPRSLVKCSIQFRSLIFPPNIIHITGKTLESEGLNVTANQVDAFRARLAEENIERREREFIVNQTNLEDCLQGTRSHNPTPFPLCGHALVFGQIRANGDVQPCNVRSDDRVVRLGNVMSPDGLLHIAVKQFQVFFKDIGDDLCAAKNCRRHGKNRYLMQKQRLVYGSDYGVSLCQSPEMVRETYLRYISRKTNSGHFF